MSTQLDVFGDPVTPPPPKPREPVPGDVIRELVRLDVPEGVARSLPKRAAFARLAAERKRVAAAEREAAAARLPVPDTTTEDGHGGGTDVPLLRVEVRPGGGADDDPGAVRVGAGPRLPGEERTDLPGDGAAPAEPGVGPPDAVEGRAGNLSHPAAGVPLPLLLDDVLHLGRGIEARDFDATAHGVGACVWLLTADKLRTFAVLLYADVAGLLDAAAAKAARRRRFPRSDPDAVDAERAAMAEEQRERREANAGQRDVP